MTKENLSRLPYAAAVTLTRQAFQRVKAFENGTLLANPPYGIRMGRGDDVQQIYTDLGDFIKQRCKGTTAFIYTGDPELRKSIGLKTSRRIPLVNGKLEGVLVRIDSYEGSKKPYYHRLKSGEESTDPPHPEEETTKTRKHEE